MSRLKQQEVFMEKEAGEMKFIISVPELTSD